MPLEQHHPSEHLEQHLWEEHREERLGEHREEPLEEHLETRPAEHHGELLEERLWKRRGGRPGVAPGGDPEELHPGGGLEGIPQGGDPGKPLQGPLEGHLEEDPREDLGEPLGDPLGHPLVGALAGDLEGVLEGPLEVPLAGGPGEGGLGWHLGRRLLEVHQGVFPVGLAGGGMLGRWLGLLVGVGSVGHYLQFGDGEKEEQGAPIGKS